MSLSIPTTNGHAYKLMLGAWFRGPVIDRLEFSFRVLACICGALFVETSPLVIRPSPRSRAQALPAPLLCLFFSGHFLLLDDAKLGLLAGLAVGKAAMHLILRFRKSRRRARE
jgi:hypothetical protein